jgi:hypothetical protein
MNIFSKISIGIVLLLSAVRASGPQPSVLASVETLLAKQEYSGARALLAQCLNTTPVDNDALYLQVAIEQAEMLDYESYAIRGERFIAAADSIRKILEGGLTKLSGRDSVACLFYIANIYGGIGIVKAKTGSWLSSLKNTRASVALLKEVIRRDSTMYAAWLGIGAFHYYLSKSFKWLPFIDDDSEKEGVCEVEKAARSPFPYGFAAQNSLCWILMERKQFGRADSVALSALREAPESTIFLRIRCLAALWNGRNGEAVAFGERLAEITRKRTPINWSDLVLSYYVVSAGNDALGKRREACIAADYILTLHIPLEFMDLPPVKKNLKRILAVKKK